MTVGVTLPRSARLTAALLREVPDLDVYGVRGVREEAVAQLTRVAADLPVGSRLKLDVFAMRTARCHPELCAAPEEPFEQRPLACRRPVGLAAVELCLRRRLPGPAVAVTEVLAQGLEDLGQFDRGAIPRAPWWARWYGQLGPGGKAAVAAEAVTWATQLWSALEWGRFPVAPLVGHDDWWDAPGTALTVRGHADLRAQVGGRPVLLVVQSAMADPGGRAELAFPALAALLRGGPRATPARVLGVWPASGQVRALEVDVALLERTASAAVSAAATWVDGILERAGAGLAVSATR